MLIKRITAEVHKIWQPPPLPSRNVFQTLQKGKYQITNFMEYQLLRNVSSACGASGTATPAVLEASNVMILMQRFVKIRPLDQLFLREKYSLK